MVKKMKRIISIITIQNLNYVTSIFLLDKMSKTIHSIENILENLQNKLQISIVLEDFQIQQILVETIEDLAFIENPITTASLQEFKKHSKEVIETLHIFVDASIKRDDILIGCFDTLDRLLIKGDLIFLIIFLL